MPDARPIDHYAALGLARTASDEVIRAAYRVLAKSAHPDAGGDPMRFREINEAHDVLTDPARRAEYDRSLDEPRHTDPSEHPTAGGPRTHRRTSAFDPSIYEAYKAQARAQARAQQRAREERAQRPSVVQGWVNSLGNHLRWRTGAVVVLGALAVTGILTRTTGALYSLFDVRPGEEFFGLYFDGPPSPSISTTVVVWTLAVGWLLGSVWARLERNRITAVERLLVALAAVVVAAGGEVVFSRYPAGLLALGAVGLLLVRRWRHAPDTSASDTGLEPHPGP